MDEIGQIGGDGIDGIIAREPIGWKETFVIVEANVMIPRHFRSKVAGPYKLEGRNPKDEGQSDCKGEKIVSTSQGSRQESLHDRSTIRQVGSPAATDTTNLDSLDPVGLIESIFLA